MKNLRKDLVIKVIKKAEKKIPLENHKNQKTFPLEKLEEKLEENDGFFGFFGKE